MFADNQRLMNKHNEFMPSSALQVRGRDIEKITRPYPQFYRIVLRSDDLSSGNEENAWFSNITMGERFSTPATLQVESFAVEKSAGNAGLVDAVYEIKLNLPQPRTWDSASKSTTYTVAVVKGHSYQQTPAVHNVGVPILDPLALQNQPINVTFKRAGVTDINFDNQSWVLVLAVVAFDDSVLP